MRRRGRASAGPAPWPPAGRRRTRAPPAARSPSSTRPRPGHEIFAGRRLADGEALGERGLPRARPTATGLRAARTQHLQHVRRADRVQRVAGEVGLVNGPSLDEVAPVADHSAQPRVRRQEHRAAPTRGSRAAPRAPPAPSPAGPSRPSCRRGRDAGRPASLPPPGTSRGPRPPGAVRLSVSRTTRDARGRGRSRCGPRPPAPDATPPRPAPRHRSGRRRRRRRLPPSMARGRARPPRGRPAPRGGASCSVLVQGAQRRQHPRPAQPLGGHAGLEGGDALSEGASALVGPGDAGRASPGARGPRRSARPRPSSYRRCQSWGTRLPELGTTPVGPVGEDLRPEHRGADEDREVGAPAEGVDHLLRAARCRSRSPSRRGCGGRSLSSSRDSTGIDMWVVGGML